MPEFVIAGLTPARRTSLPFIARILGPYLSEFPRFGFTAASVTSRSLSYVDTISSLHRTGRSQILSKPPAK